MKKSRSVIVPPILSVMLLVFVFVFESEACSCVDARAPCQAFWRADAVFVGTVTGGERLRVGEGNLEYGEWLVRFSVGEAMRGVSTGQAEVVTGLGGGDCGFEFQRGETYIVYAHRDERDNRPLAKVISRD